MFKTAEISEAYVEFLVSRNVIGSSEADDVLREQGNRTPQIGRIALRRGLLNRFDIQRILELQVATKLRFGEQAIALGLITEQDLVALLNAQWNSRPGIGQLIIEFGYAASDQLDPLRAEFIAQIQQPIA